MAFCIEKDWLELPELRLGIEPVNDGFRGMADENEPFPDAGCCFGLRGMVIDDDGGWRRNDSLLLLLLLPPELRRGMEASREDFFFGMLQEFDPLPLFPP